MQTIILILLIVLVVIGIISLIIQLTKKTTIDISQDLVKFESATNRIESTIKDEFGRSRNENQEAFKSNREELNNSFRLLSENLTKTVTDLSNAQKNQFETFSKQLDILVRTVDEKIKNLTEKIETSAKENRIEQTNSLKSFEDTFAKNVKDFNELQKQKFDDLAIKQENIKKETENKLKEIRETVEGKLKNIQEDNNKKLEEMRKTVDEKLQESINKRFNESFELISKRLEEVQKGLGEMQVLASDVGGLKKILTNVKIRGTFGEVQLESILEQIFAPSQFETQVAVKANSLERVDAVVKLPGQTSDGTDLLLPIDSKFPIQDYQRLYDAYESGDPNISVLRKAFETSVKNTAKNIALKYINPPVTTDFAIMFVPSEGIYAEILRNAEVLETLRRDYLITVVGPTNLAAFLSSLQIGFRTLAIEKRTSEVWGVLGAVKTEFGKFGGVLDKASKQLQTVAKSISETGTRTRAIERQLRSVESLPEEQAVKILGEVIEIEDSNIEDVD